jgi:hypothetical protein
MSLNPGELESLRKVLEGKAALFSTIINNCMLWWVSSVVFCGSVLSATFLKRNEIESLKNLKWFLGIVGFFFVTIVAFGSCVGIMIVQVSSQMSGILKELSMPTDSFATEFHMFESGMWLGTSSFVLILVTWIGICRELVSKSKVSATRPEALTSEDVEELKSQYPGSEFSDVEGTQSDPQ